MKMDGLVFFGVWSIVVLPLKNTMLIVSVDLVNEFVSHFAFLGVK